MSLVQSVAQNFEVAFLARVISTELLRHQFLFEISSIIKSISARSNKYNSDRS
jgi:hypothetical protein